MPVDLVSYKGDAGLGFGSNAAIPISTPDNLKAIQDTSRDILLLDADRNMKLFQQKVNDRDNLTNMILNDQVATGDILPEYEKVFEDAKAKSEQAFKDWGGNPNDIAGYKKYKTAITNLRDVAASAQTNTSMLKQLEIEKSKETLPSRQKLIQNHIDEQLGATTKDIHHAVLPFQQLHNLNMSTFAGYVQPTIAGSTGSSTSGGTNISTTQPVTQRTTTTTTTGKTKTTQSTTAKSGTTYPKDETPTSLDKSGQPSLVTYTPDTVIDFNDILKRAQSDFVAAEDGYQDQQELIKNFEDMGNDQLKQPVFKQTIDAINSQIKKYNEQRGLTGDQQVQPVKIAQVGNGYKIADNAPTFAAKFALAQQPNYVQKGVPLFNKDVATYQLGKEKNAIALKKLGIDAIKANAYAKHMNQVTKQMKDLLEHTDVDREYETFINNIKPTGIVISGSSGSKETRDAVFMDNLPTNLQYITGPVVNDKGKVVVGKLQPFVTSDKRPYYFSKYVDRDTGEEVTPNSDFVKTTFKKWKDGGFSGTKDDMVRILLKKGSLELILQGKNGAANYTTLAQSAKAINALGTKKGQENIENAPDDLPDETETQNSSDNQ